MIQLLAPQLAFPAPKHMLSNAASILNPLGERGFMQLRSNGSRGVGATRGRSGSSKAHKHPGERNAKGQQ
jgi:hypothetical protein